MKGASANLSPSTDNPLYILQNPHSATRPLHLHSVLVFQQDERQRMDHLER